MNPRHVSSLLVGLLLAGCGSDDGDGGGKLSCEPFAACGGTLTGKWQVNNACIDDATKTAIANAAKVCDQGTATVTEIGLTGSATFEQQSVVYDGVISLAISSTFPLTCAVGSTSCGDAQKKLASAEGVTGATCTTMGTTCACQYRQSIPQKGQGSYVASGSTFTVTDPSDGSKNTSEYCVNGDTLRVKTEEGFEVYTH
jgi:hypothetical protein